MASSIGDDSLPSMRAEPDMEEVAADTDLTAGKITGDGASLDEEVAAAVAGTLDDLSAEGAGAGSSTMGTSVTSVVGGSGGEVTTADLEASKVVYHGKEEIEYADSMASGYKVELKLTEVVTRGPEAHGAIVYSRPNQGLSLSHILGGTVMVLLNSQQNLMQKHTL